MTYLLLLVIILLLDYLVMPYYYHAPHDKKQNKILLRIHNPSNTVDPHLDMHKR